MNWDWLPFILYCIFAVLAVFFGWRLGSIVSSLDQSPQSPEAAALMQKFTDYFKKDGLWMMLFALFWLVFWGVVIYYLTVTKQVGYAWLILLIPVAQAITLAMSVSLGTAQGVWMALLVILLIAIYIFTIYKTKNIIERIGS